MKEVKNVENGISFALSRGRVILWGKKNLFVNTVYTPISVKNAVGVFANMDKDTRIVTNAPEMVFVGTARLITRVKNAVAKVFANTGELNQFVKIAAVQVFASTKGSVTSVKNVMVQVFVNIIEYVALVKNVTAQVSASIVGNVLYV
jgi:hypothetical protein